MIELISFYISWHYTRHKLYISFVLRVSVNIIRNSLIPCVQYWITCMYINTIPIHHSGHVSMIYKTSIHTRINEYFTYSSDDKYIHNCTMTNFKISFQNEDIKLRYKFTSANYGCVSNLMQKFFTRFSTHNTSRALASASKKRSWKSAKSKYI